MLGEIWDKVRSGASARMSRCASDVVRRGRMLTVEHLGEIRRYLVALDDDRAAVDAAVGAIGIEAGRVLSVERFDLKFARMAVGEAREYGH